MKLSDQHTAQLLKLCTSGNHLAQLEIYNRYYKAMFNVAFRIINDRYEAEDIMQDAFLLAFTKIDTLKDHATFGAWLKRIVVNNSIYAFRKTSKYSNTPFEDVAYEMGYIEEGIPEDYEFTNLKAQQVLETLKTLKENYRITLSLHLIDGYDYEEIASILNMSPANCRTTISRAKESLRQKLQPLISL